MSAEPPATPRAVYAAIGCGALLLLGLVVVPFGVALATLDDPTPETRPPVDRPVDPALAPPPTPAPGPAPGPAPAGDARRVEVVVTESQGLGRVPAGTACTMDVERHDRPDGSFVCRTDLTCDGVPLYGGADSGYFDCTLYQGSPRHVAGEDRQTSRQDADPAFRVDTIRGELELSDDATGRLGAFVVRGRVTRVE